MHRVYSISSISSCYDSIKNFILSVDVMEAKRYDIELGDSYSAVKSADDSEFISYSQLKGYVSTTFDVIPNNNEFVSSVDIVYSVFKNKLTDYYVVVAFDRSKEAIYITVIESYSSIFSPFTQKRSAYARQNKAEERSNRIYFSYYTAVACLFVESSKSELRCNYNNGCFSFSTIDISDVTRHTFNVFFGLLRPNRPYSGGLYFAGNACGYIETIDIHTCVARSVAGKGSFGHITYIGTNISLIEDISYTKIDWHFRTDDRGTFYSNLLDAPADVQMRFISSRPRKSYYNNFDIFVRIDVDAYSVQEYYWASTAASIIDNSKYIEMYSSYGTDAIDLPTYKYLLCSSNIDKSKVVNELNGISMVMPIYLMVKRQPIVLNNYSSIGYMDYVRYVSMYNCSSGSMNELEYPIENDTAKYECLALYRRRMYDVKYEMPWVTVRPGLTGYNGFAVRQFTKEIKLIDWYILTELRKNHNATEIYNSTTKIKAYQGTLEWDDLENYRYPVNYWVGYLPLICFFTYFDNIVVEYTDDSGQTKKSYTWRSIDLKNKVDTYQQFNLLGDSDSSVIMVTADDRYEYPYAQLTIVYTYPNCGLVEIIGY